jgi:hypothetical protein
MSRAGNVVIVIGLAVVVAVLLFPPFMVIDRAAAETRHAALGHHPIWRPPTPALAEQALARGPGPSREGTQASLRIGVNRVRLVFEITGAVVGAFVVLASERAWRKRRG